MLDNSMLACSKGTFIAYLVIAFWALEPGGGDVVAMTPETTSAAEIASRLSGKAEFGGDRRTLEKGISEALAEGADSDPMLSIAFQPTDAKVFAEQVSRLGAGSKQHAHVLAGQGAAISRKEANTFLLYRNLPGGVARVRLSFFDILLNAGVIKSFSWEPKIKLAD